jgi:hypothetical protein
MFKAVLENVMQVEVCIKINNSGWGLTKEANQYLAEMNWGPTASQGGGPQNSRTRRFEVPVKHQVPAKFSDISIGCLTRIAIGCAVAVPTNLQPVSTQENTNG